MLAGFTSVESSGSDFGCILASGSGLTGAGRWSGWSGLGTVSSSSVGSGSSRFGSASGSASDSGSFPLDSVLSSIPLEALEALSSSNPLPLEALSSSNPVSYTHLTLPTICSV